MHAVQQGVHAIQSHTPGPSRHPIEHLSSATRSKLRSTQIITSLPQLISELVQNSLDADARHIDIGLDCEEWMCWVRDDGSGIDRAGFDVLAGDEQVGRHGTSKAYSPASLDQVSTFGFRGEALASAADISCLEISSRTARSRECWSVILKGGATLYNGPSVRWRRESPGTVVSIRDAFYNLPIRRISHPSPSRTIELIRKDIEAFSLMFPHVSFSLENTHKSHEHGPGKTRVMTVPKTSSSLATFRHLYGKALVQHVDEINETCEDMKLQGFVSLEGAHSKAYQFLYINRHLISPCDLHRLIDGKFSSSSFAKHAFDEEGETSQPRPDTRRSPRKSEKKPVYVLNITIPPRHIDNCLEPAKAVVQLQNTDAVASFLASVIEGFLVRHGFLVPRGPRRNRHVPSGTGSDGPPSKKRRRIMDGNEDAADLLPAISRSDRATDHPGAPTTAPQFLVVDPEHHDDDPNARLTWTNPDTGETFVVDGRTGNSYPLHERRRADDEPAPQRRRTLVPASTGRAEASGSARAQSMPEWIRDALGTNVAYALREPRIPAVALCTSLSADVRGGHGAHRDRWLDAVAAETRPGRFSKAALGAARVMGQVDRKFVVCVVDADGGVDGPEARRLGKGRGKGTSLVLIDQHAADERVRVERFLRELCRGFLCHQLGVPGAGGMPPPCSGVAMRQLDPPVPVLLTHHEAAWLMAGEVRAAFARWGVAFADLGGVAADRLESHAYADADGVGDGPEKGYVQVLVRSVPEVVGEKLLAGDELKSLVKGYLAKLEAEGPPALPSTPPASQGPVGQGSDEDELPWQKAMRWCPRELLELVNSKACRGAVMFNDALTLDQCTRLVRDLAQTALPFQCAHGRPSLVPLADVGDSGGAAADTKAAAAYSPKAVDWSRFVMT